MGALKLFLSKNVWYIVGAFVLGVVLWVAYGQIKASGRSEMKAEVLEETIETTNEHVKLEEEQNEARNRGTTDAELFDSLRERTF